MRRPFGMGAGRVGDWRWRHARHRRLGLHRNDVFQGFFTSIREEPFLLAASRVRPENRGAVGIGRRRYASASRAAGTIS